MAFADAQLAALRDASGTCRCDALTALAKAGATPPVRPVSSAANVASNNPARLHGDEPAPPGTPMPVWTAVMPPLTFDAKSPAMPGDPGPQIALLIRDLRVQPVQIFRGRVEPKQKRADAARAQETSRSTERASAGKPGGFGRKFLNFFRRIFGGKPRPHSDPVPAALYSAPETIGCEIRASGGLGMHHIPS